MRKKGAALRAVQEDSLGPLAVPGSSPGLRPAGDTLPANLAFTPVPRRYRHDGWTPERQRAFIAALADTGCVDRAARMVNMAQANCYTLRRAPGAEEFRRAWEAALDCGLLIMKDIAFERAIEGQLVPVFSAGKLMGYRRKRNDALLMFCLRHYGQDANGRRVTVNYFSTRASAGSGTVSPDGPTPGPSREREGGITAAEASTMTVRTVVSGAGGGDAAARAAEAAAVLSGFEGVALDAEAEAAIAQALLACAGAGAGGGGGLRGGRGRGGRCGGGRSGGELLPLRGLSWRADPGLRHRGVRALRRGRAALDPGGGGEAGDAGEVGGGAGPPVSRTG